MDTQTVLEVRNLVTSFRTEDGKIKAVDNISFKVGKGRTLALVGESGCGKSVTSLSIMRLIPDSNGSIDNGAIVLNGRDILTVPAKDMPKVRGNEISMIFQEPMTALNPVFTIGEQIGEVFEIHKGMSKKQARLAAIEMLRKVKIPAPELRVDEYPVQLSGGMRQRVVISMALACEPQVLIADEPTTALDVTIQAQILRLMKELQAAHGTSIIFVTHDLGVVAEIADDVAIMYAGKIVEQGDVFEIFRNPKHPYTRGLMDSIPKFEDDKTRPLNAISGTVPGLLNLPTGCRFNTRCPHAKGECFSVEPPLEMVTDGHTVACHYIAGRI